MFNIQSLILHPNGIPSPEPQLSLQVYMRVKTGMGDECGEAEPYAGGYICHMDNIWYVLGYAYMEGLGW